MNQDFNLIPGNCFVIPAPDVSGIDSCRNLIAKSEIAFRFGGSACGGRFTRNDSFLYREFGLKFWYLQINQF